MMRDSSDTYPENPTTDLALKARSGKILIIGTPGSGKTTIADLLARDTGLSYISIDACRVEYSDGTRAGERTSWDQFLASCSQPAPGIVEFCGGRPHAEEVRDHLIDSGLPVSVIWLVLPENCCISRARQRQKKIPFPFPFAPLEYSVPAINDDLCHVWNSVWKMEQGFHAVRLEFSETASVDRIYTAVREIFFSDH